MKKTIVITGSSDGIGLAGAKALKEKGHTVVIVGRNPKKTERVAKELNCPYHIADFASLKEVKRLAEELRAYPQIDVLVNNAGGIFRDYERTVDGVEKTFQVNVLSPFLLTRLLLDKLIESKAKVVQTSSIASNLFAKGIDVNNLQNEGTFVSKKAYGESKLCNIFFTRELHRLYYEKGITAVAFEPGIVRSNFAAEGGWFFRTAYHTPLKYLFTISTKKSAKRMVRLVEGEEGVDFIAGKVYSYKKEYHVRYEGEEEMAKTLWKECENLLKEYL